MKKLLLLITITYNLFGASPQQVEEYLLLSNSEEVLLEIESGFSQMQNSFSQSKDESQNQTYDMQLLSLRFKDYIERNLSEDEMSEIIEHYKNVLFLQYTSAVNSDEYDQNQSSIYLAKLEQNEEYKERLELLDKLNKLLNNKEHIAIMYDDLLRPMMEKSQGGDKLDDKYFKKGKDDYLKSAIAETRRMTIYATRDFSIEELEELIEFAKRPSVDLEVKVMLSAISYALKDFFLSMSSRYDVSKH